MKTDSLFNRASKRSENGVAELPSTEASFLLGAVRKLGPGATLEEVA